jgi:SAM-dependent methyltransferase
MESRRGGRRPMNHDVTDAATVYQQLFVPAEFEEWAPRVADAARVRPGDRVLDVACGTGVLTREVAARTAPGLVTGFDLDPGMLAVARRASHDIHWCRGSADALPFADARFDCVVSQFGVMLFPDPPRALREMRRVIANGGRLAVAVWDTLERTPAYLALVKVLDRFAGNTAADALRAPFALGDRRTLTDVLTAAGLVSATIATIVGHGRYPDVRTMVEAELKGWMPVVGITLTATEIDRLVGEARIALRPYTAPDGSVRFDSPAHIVTLELV